MCICKIIAGVVVALFVATIIYFTLKLFETAADPGLDD